MDFGSIGLATQVNNKQARRILEAARDVFVQEGFTNFSARRVARVAKLSLGSVQHVFPTTEALLAAMLEHVHNHSRLQYQKMEEQLPFAAGERLNALLDYWFEQVSRSDVRKFWFGLWALSCHNKHASELLKKAYLRHVKIFATFIGAAHPTLSDPECLELATHVVAQLEGMTLFLEMSETDVSLQALIRGARVTVAQIVSAKVTLASTITQENARPPRRSSTVPRR